MCTIKHSGHRGDIWFASVTPLALIMQQDVPRLHSPLQGPRWTAHLRVCGGGGGEPSSIPPQKEDRGVRTL